MERDCAVTIDRDGRLIDQFLKVRSCPFVYEDIRRRVFQRHFSTKAGAGRGYGTYSMKLFGEGYLRGQVWFESTDSLGTVFSLKLPWGWEE